MRLYDKMQADYAALSPEQATGEIKECYDELVAGFAHEFARLIRKAPMTIFDHDAADRARAENPALTVFDTGQVLEPELDFMQVITPHPLPGTSPSSFPRKTGTVTFTNDESAPVLTVGAQPSVTDHDTTLVRIETPGGGRFKIVLNEREIWVGDVDDMPETSWTWGGEDYTEAELLKESDTGYELGSPEFAQWLKDNAEPK